MSGLLKTGGVKVLIVEDHKLHQLKLRHFCGDNGYEVVGVCSEANAAMRVAMEAKPQIALVDIHLAGSESGIDFARKIKQQQNIEIIFITSLLNDDVIKKASAVNPQAYLVKPFDAASLKAAVEMIKHKVSFQESEPMDVELDQESGLEELYIKVGKMYRRLNLDEVNWVYSSREKYIDICLNSGRVLAVRKSLNQMEKLLPNYFWRIHRSYIINSKKIGGIDSGKSFVQVADKSIPIGRSYKESVGQKVSYIS